MKRYDTIFSSLELIEERIRERLTVENLAGSAHFSKYHYQRLFREAVGESVMRYVAGRKVALAAQELVETDASVLEIALRYGYDSHEGFTRSFRTHMGVTPAEYRKYHSSIGLPQTRKERGSMGAKMKVSKNTDEIIRELNGLIVQIRETAAFTRRNQGALGLERYGEFWTTVAGRAEAAADALAEMLERVTAIVRRPDEISARFMIIKAIEDATFRLQLTAFQVRLTVARAMLEHRMVFEPICERYDALARNAGMRTERIAAFLSELAQLIFRDMRENAGQCLRRAAESGRAAAEKLSGDPALPYGYIAQAVDGLAQELADLPPEEAKVSCLEDFRIRLDIIETAADLDGLRTPKHRALLECIGDFRVRLDEAVDFFRNLPTNVADTVQETGAMGRTAAKAREDMVFQGSILLFYLRGEMQKMGLHLDMERRTALEEICGRMEMTLGQKAPDAESQADDIAQGLRAIERELAQQAQELGECGTAIAYIAKEIGNMSK
ncbi:MAG: helix-turn-helix transcriptional regulator [bacterium]|nr:helix-turn-helix transcriptional regulator [bacterium]MCM1375829.1 helix-turn-helix transcriptional regulator [Muribaculum sp.]